MPSGRTALFAITLTALPVDMPDKVPSTVIISPEILSIL